MFDLAKDGAKAYLKGVATAGLNFADLVMSLDQKKAARAGLNIIEGGLQGTERLGGFMTLAGLLVKKRASKLFSDADHTDAIDYELYKKAIEIEETERKRASGELIVDQAATAAGIQLPPATKRDIQESNSISNFLDASIIAGPFIGAGISKLVGVGGRAALAKIAPSAVANLAGRAALAGSEYAGKTLDFASKKIIQGVDEVMKSIASNVQTRGAEIIGGRALAVGLDIYGTGGAALQTAVLGKALRAVGEVGGTVLKAAGEDVPLRGALRELTETTGSDVVRFLARNSLKIAPPDSVFDAMKHVAASATNMGFLSGSLNAMQAAAAQDDPVQGFMEGFASGVGGGAVIGLAGAKGAATQGKVRRVAEFFDNDMRGRQPEVGLNINGQEVRINDINGRLELFNRPDMTPEQKQFVLQLTQANERAGGNVIFHNGSPEVVQALEGVGMGSAEGISFFNDADGRSTIILNARDMVPGTAVEEVFHAMTTDAIVKEVSNAINFTIKADAAQAGAAAAPQTPGMMAPARKGKVQPTNYLGDAMDFAERYIRTLEASEFASGRAKAAELRGRIARVAMDPEMIPDIKADILKPIIEEYAANYARAALAGMKPRNLMEGGLRNIWDSVWDKTMGNLLSAFDVSKQGAAKDPITGHFFDERGKRVINPQLERLVDRFLTSAAENLKRDGRKVSEIIPENTADGVYYFDVRSSQPFISVEDTIDGRQTTKVEKKKILNELYKSNAEFMNQASGDDNIVVVNARLKEDGAFPGNITKMKDGTPLIFTQSAPESFFDHMAQTKQFAPDQVIPNKLLNRAMSAGQIITVDAWANIGRSMTDRGEVYYGRGNRAFLPISMQQSPTGGVTWQGLDVTRVWNYTKRAARKVKAVKEELKARDIVSLQDFIPYMQRYFDNYSSTNPIPAAELKDFSPTMRDIISTALDISNRVSFEAEDAARFKNQHTFTADMIGREGANIATMYRRGDITYREQMEGFAGAGRAGKVARLGERDAMRTVIKTRESVSLLELRADRVLGVSDFSIGGAPVAIKYNPYRVTNLVRANFSPGRTTVETLGDSQVYTDAVNGKRIIVKPNGKATLFDEGRKSIHETLDDAVERANMNASRDVAEYEAKSGDRKFSNLEGKSFPVPNQQELNAMKEKLPLHSSKIDVSEGNSEGKFGTTYRVDLFDENSNKVGYAYAATDLDTPNSLLVEASYIEDSQRGKGYGQALYREVAKIAQRLGIQNLTSSSTTPNAARARAKILETNWSGDFLAAESNVPPDIAFAPSRKLKARKVTPTPEEQLKFDAESTENAFQNTSLPSRALSDKVARLYQTGVITLEEMNQSLALLNNPDTSYTTARQASAEYMRNAIKNMQLYRQGIITRPEMEAGLRAARVAETQQQPMPSPQYTDVAARNMELYRQGAITRAEMEAGIKASRAVESKRQARASAERRARLAEMEKQFVPESAQEDVAAFMAAQRNIDLVQSQLRGRKEEARAFAREQAMFEPEAAPEPVRAAPEQVVVQDPRIPAKIKIIRTSNGRFRVFYNNQLIGVKEKEEKAIQLAQRYAAA